MARPGGNPTCVGKKGKSGRKGYGIEQQKKRVLEQAFHTLKMSMTKEGANIDEKEKIDIAKQIVLKEIGKNIDITSDGEKIQPILVKFIDENNNNTK